MVIFLRTTCSLLFLLLVVVHLNGQSVSTTFHSPLLYVSTLDGTFYAIDVDTGLVRWKLSEDKAVSIPKDFQKDQKFFPDPSDGSLYIVNRGSIEKLTHTIPEMVHTSPTRTRSGLLYAGKKTDYWVSLNPDNGAKKASVTTDGIETCTALTNEGNNLYVGKTEYSLTIVDSKTATQTWNVTYVRYVAPNLADTNYEYTHYASSSDGTLATFHTDSNALLWHIRLTSPIISMFIERYGSLLKIPFRTLASDTVTSYILRDLRSLIVDGQTDVTRTLFIGRYAGGIYAMSEMMHNRDMYQPRPNYPKIGATADEDIAQGNVRTVGRHALPSVPPSLLLTQEDPNVIPANNFNDSEPQENKMQFYIIVAVCVIGLLVFVVVVSLVVMCWMITSMKNSPQQRTLDLKQKPKHVKSIGKIDVYMSDIIGHGSEGTVVYKGRFEKREVAVKRVILDFIDIDMHEVELLRQADEHPNVIRYFCMETDSSFRYLALELCQASLRDYVENTLFPRTHGQDKTLLSQTVAGIRHLHSLNIVHRDIKPGNILIQKSTKRSYTLKAIISDFGLCRKISDGRQSMTARTGSAGTDGWIAPEMLLPSKKISCAVDVFSYGCIMYYVLSNGHHPFGNDVYRRQANILNFDFDLSALSEPCQDNVLAVSLICKMVGNEQIDRPTANAVYMHPYFWNPHKQLQFYSDVSDRVEKEENSELVLRWEHNTLGPVLRGGWMNQCPELEQDLHKYRKYRTDSVRDLLRAMRNKRHHYRELPPNLLKTLGDIPDGYVQYFASRFPRLLLHTHTIMAECCQESLFKSHYPEIATFRDERREMPRYTPQPGDSSHNNPPRDNSKLALNERGEYATGEVIMQPPKIPPKAKQSKKQQQQQKGKGGNKNNGGVSADEVLSWRRSSRTESESSAESLRVKSSEFKPLSDQQSRYQQSDPLLIVSPRTSGDSATTPTNESIDGAVAPPPGIENNPKPWFKQYSVALKGGVLSKRFVPSKQPIQEKT